MKMAEEQKIYREHNQDGFNEIIIGVILILSAGVFVIPLIAGILLAIVLISVVKIYERFKQKITEPRLGYVKFQTTESGKSIFFGLILFFTIIITITALALVVISNDPKETENWYKMSPFLHGLVMIGPASQLVEKSGLKQYWLVAAYPMCQGAIITLLTINNESYGKLDGHILNLFIMGIVFIAVGIILLIKFIKIPVMEDE
jgi:predicted small integral membrane protein